MDKSFELEFRLRSPMILGMYPVTLDALLGAAIYLKTQDVQQARDDIPLVRDAGVYCGSTGVFEETNDRPLLRVTAPMVGSMRSETDLRPGLYQENRLRGGGGYLPFTTTSGATKARFDKYEAYTAHSIVYRGMGDPDACFDLAGLLMSIGPRAKAGWGSVERVILRDPIKPYSHRFDDNRPARPVPLSAWLEMGGSEKDRGMSAITPPYWQSDQVECAMPPRLRKRKR